MKLDKETIKKYLLIIAKPFIWLALKIKDIYFKIFPRREAKYFDADRHELKYIGLMVCYAIGINLYIEWFARITKGPFMVFTWILHNPLVFLLNALIIFATMTIALLFKRRRFAWMIISMLWIVIGTVNGIILLQRVTPFTLYDLANFADGLTIINSYYKKWQITLIGVGAVLIVLSIIIIFVRSKKWQNIHYGKSCIAIILSVAAALGATYGSIELKIVNTYFGNLNYAYRDYGVPYCFIATSVSAGVKKPKGYSEAMIDKILDEKTVQGQNTVHEMVDDDELHPNLIVLQMESFTTADSYSHIKVDKDPTPVFNSLKEQYTSGWLEVPACGAGTSNTEFEVLTGISARFFGPGEYPYKGKLREHTLENMAYIAKNHGYACNALHNHRALFYNRNEVYANMGFDSFTSVEYMNNVSFTPKNWCKDKVLIPEIMDIMTSTAERDMMHIVSVEGHGKYPEEQVFKNPYTTVSCKDEATKWKYEYYLNECHEMDTFIGNLIDEINAAGEPTVMVIYGDHIPALDVEESQYNGPDLYSTEYVIWDNIGLPKQDEDTTSYEVGAKMLEAAGLGHEGIIFDYQQTNSKDSKSYLKDQEALAHDMLYGKYYAYGGENPYERTDMKMGFHKITVKKIVKIGDKYYIKGKNFTERSIISLDGKKLSTVYLSPTLLALNETIDDEDAEKLVVAQVDKSDETILTTVGANEEL